MDLEAFLIRFNALQKSHDELAGRVAALTADVEKLAALANAAAKPGADAPAAPLPEADVEDEAGD